MNDVNKAPYAYADAAMPPASVQFRRAAVSCPSIKLASVSVTKSVSPLPISRYILRPREDRGVRSRAADACASTIIIARRNYIPSNNFQFTRCITIDEARYIAELLSRGENLTQKCRGLESVDETMNNNN